MEETERDELERDWENDPELVKIRRRLEKLQVTMDAVRRNPSYSSASKRDLLDRDQREYDRLQKEAEERIISRALGAQEEQKAKREGSLEDEVNENIRMERDPAYAERKRKGAEASQRRSDMENWEEKKEREKEDKALEKETYRREREEERIQSREDQQSFQRNRALEAEELKEDKFKLDRTKAARDATFKGIGIAGKMGQFSANKKEMYLGGVGLKSYAGRPLPVGGPGASAERMFPSAMAGLNSPANLYRHAPVGTNARNLLNTNVAGGQALMVPSAVRQNNLVSAASGVPHMTTGLRQNMLTQPLALGNLRQAMSQGVRIQNPMAGQSVGLRRPTTGQGLQFRSPGVSLQLRSPVKAQAVKAQAVKAQATEFKEVSGNTSSKVYFYDVSDKKWVKGTDPYVVKLKNGRYAFKDHMDPSLSRIVGKKPPVPGKTYGPKRG